MSSDLQELQATAHRRLNVGCGEFPMRFWTNLDARPDVPADVHQSVPPLQFDDASFDEIYAGHFLEHLAPIDARVFLSECFRCLAPGGRLGVLVPDTREIMTRWLRGDHDCVEYPSYTWHAVNDLDAVCGLFLYSNVQVSPHKWSYDLQTLGRAIIEAGFTLTREIDRYRDERIQQGAWYQCGWDATRPAVSA